MKTHTPINIVMSTKNLSVDAAVPQKRASVSIANVVQGGGVLTLAEILLLLVYAASTLRGYAVSIV